LFANSRQAVLSKYLGNRASSTSKLDTDSLHMAEEEFSKRKLRNPVNFTSQAIKDSDEELQSEGSRARSSSPIPRNNSLHYPSSLRTSS
jgi:hypothetical protein